MKGREMKVRVGYARGANRFCQLTRCRRVARGRWTSEALHELSESDCLGSGVAGERQREGVRVRIRIVMVQEYMKSVEEKVRM